MTKRTFVYCLMVTYVHVWSTVSKSGIHTGKRILSVWRKCKKGYKISERTQKQTLFRETAMVATYNISGEKKMKKRSYPGVSYSEGN